MAPIAIPVKPVEVGGCSSHQAACEMPGCTLSAAPWPSKPQPIRTAMEKLTHIHRQDHRVSGRPSVLGPP